MKKKIAKTALVIILIITSMLLTVAIYYLTADIQTKMPQRIDNTCNIEAKNYMGRNVFIVSPKEKQNESTKILYFHGGSYVAEATEEHWNFIEQIVKDTKATVILPDYPLTPKYTYKDVFNMVEPMYKEIVEQVGKEKLIVMGDSAGGGLTLGLLEKIAEENIEQPKKTILISPWLDVRLTNPKIDEVQKIDTQLNKETLKLAGIAYSGVDGQNSYLVNPIDGNLSNLEHVTIFTGTKDILNPDVHVFQEKAKEVNVDIEIKEYENANHIWMIHKTENEDIINRGYQDVVNLIKGS